jgi:hypothetical protein
MIKEDEFREDLYFRMNTFEIRLPALRERRSDIPVLVSHFIDKLRERTGTPVRGVSEAALARLTGRHGRPALNQGTVYTMWREAEILYATRLEFRCLDPGRGLYSLTLEDPFRERLFHKSLARRLLPTLEATLLVLR